MVYFRNGDADLVYNKNAKNYDLCICKCGETGFEQFRTLGEVVKCLSEVYGFEDDMILELVKTVEISDK